MGATSRRTQGLLLAGMLATLGGGPAAAQDFPACLAV